MRCKACRCTKSEALPPVGKKVISLDQFTFSELFKLKCGKFRGKRRETAAGLLVAGRHLADNLRRERNPLPEGVESRPPGEIPPVQNDDIAVDQVGGDRVRDDVLKLIASLGQAG